jgi:hypothetical protein
MGGWGPENQGQGFGSPLKYNEKSLEASNQGITKISSSFLKLLQGRAKWFTPVILTSQEVKIGTITIFEVPLGSKLVRPYLNK